MSPGAPPSFTGPAGFALVLALLAIVALGALVIGGHQIASSQFRLGQARRAENAAFYSAEAGLEAARTAWEGGPEEAITPGASRKLLEGRLASGDAYHVWGTRLDDGNDPWRSLYLIRSVGLAHGSRGGRRQLGLFVRIANPDAFCCYGAVTPSEVVTRAPGARFGQGTGGAEAGLEGCEASGEAPEGRAGYADSGLSRAQALYDALSARPDIRIDAADTSVADFESDNHRPVIHATGDLALRGGSGAGVLMVDGDLVLSDGFEFRGTILVNGNLSLEGEATRIVGTVALLGPAPVAARLGPGTEVVFSRCEAMRSLRESGLSDPRPLAQHAWLEIFK